MFIDIVKILMKLKKNKIKIKKGIHNEILTIE